MKKLKVTVDGKTYDVVVEGADEPVRQAPSAGPVLQQTSVAPPSSSAARPASSGPAAGAGSVASPLSGRIVSVDCSVGQKVVSGDKLVTVEAMKMHTFVAAASDGVVTAIAVQAGDVVEEGQVLVTIG
jgi:biotin carboxyl carrier protein